VSGIGICQFGDFCVCGARHSAAPTIRSDLVQKTVFRMSSSVWSTWLRR